jgi:hypothetical protein
MFGHDHDAGHVDSGHDAGHDSEPAASVFSTFSTKVIGTFIMGFGGGGAIAQYAWVEVVRSSFTGFGVGVVMGGFMYLVMRLMYGQQSTSLVECLSQFPYSGFPLTPVSATGRSCLVVSPISRTR